MATWLSRFSQSRRVLKDLDRIASALEYQSILLHRLTDHLAPIIADPSAEDLRTSGPSFSRDAEQGRILDFVGRVYKDTGREPTDEEIVRYLDGEPV